jgi:hypothetical protein
MKRFIVCIFLILSVWAVSDRANAQGANASFIWSSTFPATAVGKTSQRPLLIISNLDSTKSLHGHIGQPSTAFFALIGSDTILIGPLQKDSIYLHFLPDSAGPFADSLFVTHDAQTSAFLKTPLRLALRGTGLPAGDTSARIQVIPSAMAMVIYVDTIATRNIIIHNTSDTAQDLYGNILNINPPFYFGGSRDGSFHIAQNQYDTIPIVFRPSVAGQYLDTLLVSSNADPANRMVVVNVLAAAYSRVLPTAALSPISITFWDIPIGIDSTLASSLTNTSSTFSPLYDTIITPSEPFSLDRTTPRRGSVSDGYSTDIKVHFKPIAPGSYSDSIVLLTNAATARMVIPLEGHALALSVKESKPVYSPHLVILPNPASTHFRVQLEMDREQKVRLALFDEAGTLAVSLFEGSLPPGVHMMEYPTHDLADGTYVVRLECEGTLTTAKVIVRH